MQEMFKTIFSKIQYYIRRRTIREVMKNDNNDKFTGTTEIDEVYIGE